MNATSLYVSTCRLVLQANPEDPGCWADLYRLIPYLRQSLSCTVCGNLLIEPYTPTETNCQHHVCRSCKGGKKKLKPSCSWCKNYEKYVENVQLRILLQCYKKLCEYIINSSIYRLMCKTTASGDTNIANMTDLIQEGAGFKDEFKSNSGLSKSAYSILPCIYASASTQTITQTINLNNDSDIAIDEDVSVAKSNLSNGSSIYSVTYAGSGNKMVIKRKAMLNKGEMENCENLRLIKGSNFKRPIHRRGNFRGRGRGFKEEEKTNSTGVSNCTVSTNNVNSGRVNVKKKKLGCRCGNATASPGKLTCCGQRCPCYVDSKACLDCKCRGCRNPHTKEGQKVIRDPIDSANKLQSPAQLQTDEGIPNKSNAYLSESVSSASQGKWSCEAEPARRPTEEITITVESLENVDETKVKEVMVMVDFLGSVLNQSYQIPVNKSRADIDLTTGINVQDITYQFMNEILANPVVFTVFDCTLPGSVPIAAAIPPTSVEVKKKMSKSSASPVSVSKTFMHGTAVLGMCNLDIGSLVMGEKRIKKTLLVESDKKLTPLEKVAASKLPKLVVVVSTGDEPLVPESSTKFNNVLSVTVESIYNAPDYISDGSIFEACIQVPTIGEKNSRLKFPNGVASSVREFTCRKKWVNLSDIEGPGAKSNYRILPEACDVISDLPGKEVLDNDLTKPQKTIRWDMWKSCLMLKADVNHFHQKIIKYRVWPIEIFLPNKSKEQIQKEKSAKSDKKSKPVPSATVTNADHFTAFLNLAPLLHPGETRVRAAAQLLTYSQADLVNKFGMEMSLLQVQASVATVKGKTTSERSKASIREPEEIKDVPGSPVCGFDGSPTFIIVEVELLKPLTRKRDPESVEEDLREFVSVKGKINKKTTSLAMVVNNFSQSIMDMVSTLTKEYQTFSLSHNTPNERKPDDIHFYDFICKQKNFYRMRATLENRIVDIIQEKYGSSDQLETKLPSVYAYLVNEMHKITNHYTIEQDLSFPRFNTSELQLYSEEALEEGECELAKEYLLLRLARNTSNPDYWLDIAACCIRLNSYDRAIEAVREALCLDFYHQIALLMYALIMTCTSNAGIGEMAFEVLLTKYPDFVEGWMALQFFYTTFGNPEAAIIACRQAKILESERNRPKDSSIKLTESKQVDFCLKTHENDKYYPAGDEKCGMGSFVNGFSWSEPLSWTTTICPPDNIRLRTTVLLLKLGFYQFASMCLSDELLSYEEEDKPTPALVYYTCVNYYLQQRYEDAIPLLQKYANEYGQFKKEIINQKLYKIMTKEISGKQFSGRVELQRDSWCVALSLAVTQDGATVASAVTDLPDCFIWALLGHCYFKLENHAQAIACYEYVIQSFNRPDDIHLVYTRMGFYYLQAHKYPCAKHTLQAACKYSPSPRLWKGVGISSLMTEDFEDAEIAFTEANYLDSRDPETWAYLAITNALLRRLDLFKNCYAEAIKRGLCNEDLVRKIKCFARVNGLTDEELGS